MKSKNDPVSNDKQPLPNTSAVNMCDSAAPSCPNKFKITPSCTFRVRVQYFFRRRYFIFLENLKHSLELYDHMNLISVLRLLPFENILAPEQSIILLHM